DGAPGVLTVLEGVEQAEDEQQGQGGGIDQPAAPAIPAPVEKKRDKAPRQHQAAEDKASGDQPRGEVAPLNLRRAQIGDVGDQGRGEKGRGKGEKNSVNGGADHPYGRHGSRLLKLSCPLQPPAAEMVQRLERSGRCGSGVQAHPAAWSL